MLDFEVSMITVVEFKAKQATLNTLINSRPIIFLIYFVKLSDTLLENKVLKK